MISWLTFAGIFVLFFATHSIPVRPPVKRHIVNLLGSRGFTLAYSALSLAMLALLIWAARHAPFVELWTEAPWHRTTLWIGMLIACLLFSVSIGQPNPFSFGGGNRGVFDPHHAGIVGYIRHPLLVVLALWAGLHGLVNGDLAHVLLFGTLGLFALAGQRIIDVRKRRQLGIKHWGNLRNTSREHRHIPRLSRAFLLRIGGGLAMYLILVALHPLIIGRSVFL